MATFGFPRSRRLTQASEYDAVFKVADHRVSGREFLVLARVRGDAQSRVGTVVSKKHAGNGAERNRIRRVIKESFRCSAQCEGLDVVVVARPPVRNRTNAALAESLTYLFQKLSSKHQSQK